MSAVISSCWDCALLAQVQFYRRHPLVNILAHEKGHNIVETSNIKQTCTPAAWPSVLRISKATTVSVYS